MAITVSGTNVQVRDPNRTVSAVRATATSGTWIPVVAGTAPPTCGEAATFAATCGAYAALYASCADAAADTRL